MKNIFTTILLFSILAFLFGCNQAEEKKSNGDNLAEEAVGSPTEARGKASVRNAGVAIIDTGDACGERPDCVSVVGQEHDGTKFHFCFKIHNGEESNSITIDSIKVVIPGAIVSLGSNCDNVKYVGDTIDGNATSPPINYTLCLGQSHHISPGDPIDFKLVMNSIEMDTTIQMRICN